MADSGPLDIYQLNAKTTPGAGDLLEIVDVSDTSDPLASDAHGSSKQVTFANLQAAILAGGNAGTVTTVSVATANGISGTVANPTTTPAITLTLVAITPSSVNGNTITTGTGTLTLSTYTLTVAGTASVSGTNTGDQTSVSGSSGSCTGNAATATALATGRTINGVTFDGTANIVVTAAAGTLTGTTLNATVVTSSLTSVGTIGTGTWQGTAIAAAYLPSLDAITAAAGNVNLNTHKLINVVDPTAAQDAATKNYVDMATAALAAKNDCAAATATALAAATYNNGSSGVGATLTLTVAAVLVLDGYTPILNDRLLIKNQTAPAQNGIYYLSTVGVLGVTQAVLTRTLDFDQAGDGINGALVYVLNGTANGNTLWSCTTAASVTFGTTAINWSKFLGSTYTADETTLHLAGTTFSIISTYVGQTSIVTLGTITTGVWNGTPIANAYLSVIPSQTDFRLSFTSATPYPLADLTAQGTVYLTPLWNSSTDKGYISTPDSGTWTSHNTAELSVAFANMTAGNVYDLFLFNNAGTLTIVAGTAWTNKTTRATLLAASNGWFVNNSTWADVITGTISVTAKQARWLGTVYIPTTNNQSEDSYSNRYLYNAQNQTPMELMVCLPTGNYSLTGASAAVTGVLANYLVGQAKRVRLYRSLDITGGNAGDLIVDDWTATNLTIAPASTGGTQIVWEVPVTGYRSTMGAMGEGYTTLGVGTYQMKAYNNSGNARGVLNVGQTFLQMTVG